MGEVFYVLANAFSSQGDYRLSNFYINSEPYDDLNDNGQWDAGLYDYENLLNEDLCEAD